MKAGIFIDGWKLPVFQKGLKAAGFDWLEARSLTTEVITLTVETERMNDLKATIDRCNKECRLLNKAKHRV